MAPAAGNLYYYFITAGMVVEREPCVRGKMSENAMRRSKVECYSVDPSHSCMQGGRTLWERDEMRREGACTQGGGFRGDEAYFALQS